MKKIILLVVCLLLSANTFSQTVEEKRKAISIIEDLTYDEYYIATKCIEQIKINFDSKTGRIEIDSYSYFGDDNNVRSKKVFYISDLDLSTFNFQTAEIDKGKFMLDINIKAKEGSITQTLVSVDKSQFTYPVSKTEYLNVLNVGTTKLLSQFLIDKLLLNYKILLGVKK